MYETADAVWERRSFRKWSLEGKYVTRSGIYRRPAEHSFGLRLGARRAWAKGGARHRIWTDGEGDQRRWRRAAPPPGRLRGSIRRSPARGRHGARRALCWRTPRRTLRLAPWRAQGAPRATTADMGVTAATNAAATPMFCRPPRPPRHCRARAQGGCVASNDFVESGSIVIRGATSPNERSTDTRPTFSALLLQEMIVRTPGRTATTAGHNPFPSQSLHTMVATDCPFAVKVLFLALKGEMRSVSQRYR